MLEAPEALYLSEELHRILRGKQLTEVIAAYTPHKFAWFNGPADTYPARLAGKRVEDVAARGGMIDLLLTADTHLVFSDGVNLRYYHPAEPLPPRHQLLLGFDDESCLVASVRMYGALNCFRQDDSGSFAAGYYEAAKTKPQVMSEAFTLPYFRSLIDCEEVRKKNVKAFLATEQRIPGLGNGVLQDILYEARLHPKRKVSTLTDPEKETLYAAVRAVLRRMYAAGGRNSETDLYGRPGRYVPFLSKDTAGKPCSRCGEVIRKENFMGGSIYYCADCQPLDPSREPAVCP